MTLLSRIRIIYMLPLIMVLLTVGTVAAVSTAAYLRARETLRSEAVEMIESVGQLKVDSLGMLLDSIARDLNTQVLNPFTAKALRELTGAFVLTENAEAVLTETYVTGNPNPVGKRQYFAGPEDGGSYYDLVHRAYHGGFHALQRQAGYYDVFLIDTKGNIVYTVFKEQDFATNLETGAWKDSGLARVFRMANAAGPGDAPAFVDFDRYAPSNGDPASFIAHPVFADDGSRLGVLAYQMPGGLINDVTTHRSGLGQTGKVFLVGSDGKMHTDLDPAGAPDLLKTDARSAGTDAAFSGQTGVQFLTDSQGRDVIAY